MRASGFVFSLSLSLSLSLTLSCISFLALFVYLLYALGCPEHFFSRLKRGVIRVVGFFMG